MSLYSKIHLVLDNNIDYELYSPFFPQQKLVGGWQSNSLLGTSLIHFHALVNSAIVLMEDAVSVSLGAQKGHLTSDPGHKLFFYTEYI